jgi:hypothetical protein
MDEALERVRRQVMNYVQQLSSNSWFLPDSGLVLNEDVPDIVANTFLVEVTQEQLDAIGLGFLQHRECE